LTPAFAYEHEEQFDEPHVAQEEPCPLDDDVNLYPTENPKEDIFFFGSFAPH
jgi:hypothetical protein